MQLKITQNKLIENAKITCAVDDGLFSFPNIRHFDNDGFQLNHLEQAYYQVEGIEIPECLGVHAAQVDWFELHDPAGSFILDHSLLITRFCYSGSAEAQLRGWSGQFPQLKKFLMLKPKWGLDFALEFTHENEYIEVLHIEQDFDSYRRAEDARGLLEIQLTNTDWWDFTDQLLKHKSQWESLQGQARNDWKAQYWGLDKAEHILKAF
jgi:hypothetical protein